MVHIKQTFHLSIPHLSPITVAIATPEHFHPKLRSLSRTKSGPHVFKSSQLFRNAPSFILRQALNANAASCVLLCARAMRDGRRRGSAGKESEEGSGKDFKLNSPAEEKRTGFDVDVNK